MQDYYEIMNLNAIELQQKKDFEIKEAIKKAFLQAAMIHHPDKGGDEEIFKELNNARDVLSDPARRTAYDAMLKQKIQSEIYSDDHRPRDIPHPTETMRTFQANVPFDDIQQEFAAFFREKMGDEAVASEHGYHSEYAYDPKTGRDILVLHFPNEEVANEFIGQMIEKGLIKNPEILQDERAADASRFSPFKNYAETPCLDRD